MKCWKEKIYNFTKHATKFMIDVAKDQYPKIVSHKEKIKKVKEEADPIIEQKKKSASKVLTRKYENALNIAKKAEQDKKKAKMRAIRNAIVGTTIGFTAGAATGYVLVKKSQIKESDYVFSDNDVNNESKDSTSTSEDAAKKSFQDFNENYKISTDGTTLIKK